jgi:hypothetical protein
MELVYTAFGCKGLTVAIPFDYQRNERNFKGEAIVRRNIKFDDMGFLRLDTEKDAETINILDFHKGNEANGGEDFRLLPQAVNAAMIANQGGTFAEMPKGGLLESDIENLTYLAKLKSNMPPNTVKKAAKIMENVYERFMITGIAKVTASSKPIVMFAQKTIVLDTLEERGIWADGNTEGEGSSGQSPQED